jgi:hypothetical protein
MLDACGVGQGAAAGCCEYGTETSDSLKVLLLNQLRRKVFASHILWALYLSVYCIVSCPLFFLHLCNGLLCSALHPRRVCLLSAAWAYFSPDYSSPKLTVVLY